MARRRRTIKRKTTRRRSRMGAIGKAGLMDLAYSVAGGVAARYVSNTIQGFLPSSLSSKVSAAIAGAAPIAVGMLLPKKSPFYKGLANGMQVVGAVNLVAGLTGIAGVGLVPNASFTMPTVGAIEDAGTDVRSMPMAMVAGSYC